MTCRDRNRRALQAELLLAYTRDIRNVLCLTGDAVPVGDHKEAKGVFDLDSLQLIEAVHLMESGKDLGGNDLDGTVKFCAACIRQDGEVYDGECTGYLCASAVD